MSDHTNRALAQLDAAEMTAFLQALVRTPSVFLPGVEGTNEEAAARLIYDLLCSWGWDVRWEEVAPGRPNVIAELPGRLGDGGEHTDAPLGGHAGPPLLLMEGHSDVVTPGDRAAWSDDPFGGAIIGRRLYGRGAVDMKGGVAAMLYAARAIQLAGSPFCGTLRLLIPVDEEGMMLGIKHMVARGHAAGAVGAIICEPEGREVCVAQKGSLRLRLISYGRIAHGAMPFKGVNALAAMVRWLGRVIDLEAELNAAHGEHPLLGRSFISPTVARAPLSGDASQINCLPDCCDAFLDIRSVPAVSHPALIARIRALADAVRAEHPDYRFDLEVIDDRPATEVGADHPIVQAIVAAHTQVYGEAPPFGGVPGSTDGTILTRDAGVPVVVYGPGDKWLPHQPDEHVDLDEVERAARVYIIAALRLLGEG